MIFLLRIIIVFGLLFWFAPKGFDSVSSTRIVYALLMVNTLFFFALKCKWKGRYFGAEYLLISVALASAAYSGLILTLDQSDFVQLSRNGWFLVISVMSVFSIYSTWSSLGFQVAVLIACLAQSFFVLISYVSAEYREFATAHIATAGNYGFESTDRAIGLAGAGGANLSLAISMGISSAYLISREPLATRTRFWLLLISVVVMLLATLLTARTGLLVGGLMALTMAIRQRKYFGSIFTFSIVIGLASMPVMIWIDRNNPQFFAYTLDWALSVFSGSDKTSTLSSLWDMGFPSMTLFDWLAGTSRVSDASSGGNASGVDIGYVQTLYALGLPMTLVFYLGLLVSLMLIASRTSPTYLRNWSFFLIAVMFVCELKEPFIFKYSLPIYVMATVLLGSASGKLAK